MSAAWSRPQRVIPPKSPANHQRSRSAAQAMPAIPSTVSVCGHMPFAATLQTGVVKPNARATTAASRAGRRRSTTR